MRRKGLMVLLAALIPLCALLIPGSESDAKINPMGAVTSNISRAEVIIVLDTSGSMRFNAGGSDRGTDCAPTTGADVCGDKQCTGDEHSSCAADCPISNSLTLTAGSVRRCYSGATGDSRMAIAKRALRTILPALRTVASFSLVTFAQSGHYQYHQGVAPAASTYSTIYLSKEELQATTNWTGGGGWNTGTNVPQTFTANGVTYTKLSSSGISPAISGDSLYRREDTSGFYYARFAFATAGLAYNDGTYNWTYIGSYFTFDAPTLNAALTSRVETAYKGPVYIDSGTYWVHRRYSYDSSDNSITAGSTGQILEPLIVSSAQAAHDTQIAKIMQRLNFASNGGIITEGGTPTGPAMTTALTQFQDRYNATGAYSGSPDPAKACRKRIMLVMFDGSYDSGTTNPVNVASDIYSWGNGIGNQVSVRTVGVPGLPASAVTLLDDIADKADDDNKTNNTAFGLVSANERDLINNIRAALFGILQGDYTTGSAGVASTAGASTPDNVAIVPSTEYPGWKGHLRALDLGKDPSDPLYELWDAAAVLAARNTGSNPRKLWTSDPTGSNSTPIPILCGTSPNVDGTSCGGGRGVQHAWPGTAPSSAEITQVINYVADLQLRAMFRSTPATVGPPPQYPSTLGGHDAFVTANAARPTLIYAASNVALHAFDPATGAESFAYVPPALWPKILAIVQASGQSADPDKFVYGLASSPRVEDVVIGGTWSTQLVLTYGPGAAGYVALDITDPTTDPPFSVAVNSVALSNATANISTAWSLPAIFYGSNTQVPMSVAFGSGYVSSGTLNRNYHAYGGTAGIWSNTDIVSNATAPSGTPRVDYARVANVVAAVNADLSIIATYVADTSGRILRFDKGLTSTVATVIDGTGGLNNAGVDHPFQFAPAALHIGNSNVLLAFNSGAFQEDGSWMKNAGFESKVWLRRDAAGTISSTDDVFSCAISSICNASCYGGTAPTGPCTAPSANALPLSSPLLVDNIDTGQKEAFYLYYDPPSTACSGSNVALGDTYVIRVATTGAIQTAVSSTRYAGTVASGFAIVGGGTDLALITSQRGTAAKAAAKTYSGTALAAPGTSPPIIEGWREVD